MGRHGRFRRERSGSAVRQSRSRTAGLQEIRTERVRVIVLVGAKSSYKNLLLWCGCRPNLSTTGAEHASNGPWRTSEKRRNARICVSSGTATLVLRSDFLSEVLVSAEPSPAGCTDLECSCGWLTGCSVGQVVQN